MDHRYPRRDLGQGDRPIDRRIAAAGDDHPLVPEILTPADQVEDAAAFVILDPLEGRPVGPEGPASRRDDQGAGVDHISLGGADPPAAVVERGHGHDLPAEVIDRGEGGRLQDKLVDQRHGVDNRIAGDIVDRLLGVQGRALAADHVEGVDDMAAHAQHAGLEHREQADGAGADDDDIAGLGRG